MTDAEGPVDKPGLVEGLGERTLRRAEPRTSIAVAGAGCALAVLGVLIISGDTGSGDSGFNRWPGVIFSAAVVAAGYFVLARFQRGALATGGSVAAALGVPPLMFFLTLDVDGFPPYSTEGILFVSTAAWLISYFFGPGRGRPFFLGAGLVALWLSLLQMVEDVFDAPFMFFGSFASSFDDTGDVIFGPGPSFDAPDPMTLGMISLIVGIGYFVWMKKLDDSGRHGMATPVAAAMIPPLVAAPLLLADDLQSEGSGLLTMAIGACLAFFAAPLHRRGVTWLGGAAVTLGAAIFLADMTDNATVGGMLFLAAGIALVFAAHAWATAKGEPDEMQITPVGSRFVAIQTQTQPPPPNDPQAPPPPPTAPF